QFERLIPKPAVLEICNSLIKEEFRSISSGETRERKQILKELDEANARLQRARLMRIDGDLGEDDFAAVKTQVMGRIEVLERKLSECVTLGREVKSLIEGALKKVSNLSTLYKDGNLEEKRQVLGSIFPENLVFEGNRHRTTRLNEIVRFICLTESDLPGKKMGQVIIIVTCPMR